MKLRNWLPTKYLTEENPMIGLSFEVGYARIAVMVGQTVIHTMSNMIRADYDSQIFNCIPAWMYQKQAPYSVLANKHHSMGGGFRRQDNGMLEIHSALTPRFRSAMQYTGMEYYADYDHMHRFLNTPYLYPNVGTIGHVDRGPTFPGYLTHVLYEKNMRQAAIDAGFGEMDYMARKVLNNGRSGVPSPESGHSSLTALYRTVPKYRLTNMHGGRGVIIPVFPHADEVICYKAGNRLGEKYYFTGEGMLPKGL